MSKSLETALQKALAHEFGPNRRKRECLGPLHRTLTTFLPDFVDKNEKYCNLTRLAMALDMTYAGVHRWTRIGEMRNRIKPEMVEKLIQLSAMSKTRPEGFRPATIADFWEFMAS